MSEALRVRVLLGDGLAAAVWTSGLPNAHRAARTLKSGTVGVTNYDGGDLTVRFGVSSNPVPADTTNPCTPVTSTPRSSSAGWR